MNLRFASATLRLVRNARQSVIGRQYGPLSLKLRLGIRKTSRGLKRVAGKILPVLLAGGLGLSLAYGIIFNTHDRVLAAVVGILVSAIVLIRIQVGLIAVIILAASFMHYNFVPKPVTIGGQGLSAIELLIGFTVSAVFLRAIVRKELGRLKTPITLPLVLFGVSVILSILTGYVRHLADPHGPWQFRDVYLAARPLFVYLFFFAVLLGVNTERDLKVLLNIILVILMVVALMMVAQYYAGPSVKLFLGTEAGLRVESLSGEERSVTRSLPPAMAPILMLFPITMLLACIGNSKNRLWYGIAGSLLGVGIIFSLTRMNWITMMIAAILMWLLSSRTVKKRLAVILVIIPLLVVGGSVAIGRVAPGLAGQKFSAALAERFTSMFEHKTLRSGSLQHRFKENRYAIGQIKRNPVFGVGPGIPAYYAHGRNWRGQQVIIPEYSIHNSYLELLMVFGLPGVISFAWLCIAFLWRCMYIIIVYKEPMHKAMAIGAFAAFIGFLIRASGSMTFLHEVSSILALALIWGVVEVVARLGAISGSNMRKSSDMLPRANDMVTIGDAR